MRPYEGIDRAFEIVPEAVVVLKLQAGFRVPTTPAPCIFSIENIRYLYLQIHRFWTQNQQQDSNYPINIKRPPSLLRATECRNELLDA
jgi:hypothetical protein